MFKQLEGGGFGVVVGCLLGWGLLVGVLEVVKVVGWEGGVYRQ